VPFSTFLIWPQKEDDSISQVKVDSFISPVKVDSLFGGLFGGLIGGVCFSVVGLFV
jgi:hypothetical protein